MINTKSSAFKRYYHKFLFYVTIKDNKRMKRKTTTFWNLPFSFFCHFVPWTSCNTHSLFWAGRRGHFISLLMRAFRLQSSSYLNIGWKILQMFHIKVPYCNATLMADFQLKSLYSLTISNTFANLIVNFLLLPVFFCHFDKCWQDCHNRPIRILRVLAKQCPYCRLSFPLLPLHSLPAHSLLESRLVG